MAYVPKPERRRRIPLWAWGLAIGVPVIGIGAWYFLAKAGVVPPPSAVAPAPTPTPEKFSDDSRNSQIRRVPIKGEADPTEQEFWKTLLVLAGFAGLAFAD